MSTKMVLLFVLAFMLTGFVSGSYLMNSQDWRDVYYGSYESYSEGETPYFVRGGNLGVFNVLPYGEPVNIIESEEEPVVANIESQASAQGYDIGEVRNVQTGSLDLVSDDPENLVVVPRSYPAAAVVAAPYARAIDGDVVVAGDENIDSVEPLVEEASNTVMIGDFTREVSNSIGEDADRRIISADKFNLSVQVAEAYLEEENSSRVLITSGDYLSRDIVEGETPVLLSGTNFMPESMENFLLNDPEHGIDTAVMIGNEMTNVGEDIRDNNITRNGETTDEKVSVFVKYGQARGDSNSIYAISLFPLPTGEISLEITSTRYNPETEEILITYENSGESRMYQLTSFELMSENGEVIAQGGDDEPVFIGSNTERTISYDVDLESGVEDSVIEFSTNYGTSPGRLDTYLTESGQFSPPLRKNISTVEIDDSSNISLNSLKYVKGIQRFRGTVENHGDEPSYAQLRLTDVSVSGQSQSFASEREKVPADSSKTIFIPAELDRIDLQENERVTASLSYGSNENALVKSSQVDSDFEVVENRIKPWMIAGVVVLLLIGAAVLANRKLDIEVKTSD